MAFTVFQIISGMSVNFQVQCIAFKICGKYLLKNPIIDIFFK